MNKNLYLILLLFACPLPLLAQSGIGDVLESIEANNTTLRAGQQLNQSQKLEARTGKKQRHAKLPAFAPEILLQLAHGLLYHRRRGLLVTSTEQMLQATLYSAGMLLHNPITQTEAVAPGA